MGKRVTDDDKAKFLELSEKGYTAPQIHEETGFSPDTIRRHLAKMKKGDSPPDESSPATEDSGVGSDEDPIFGSPVPDFAGILKGVLEDMGIDKKKLDFIHKAVSRAPQYQEANGLFQFLTGMGIDGMKAKITVEQVFGEQAQLIGQQSMNPGQPNMPRVGFQGGQPMMTPQFPQQPTMPGQQYQPQFQQPQQSVWNGQQWVTMPPPQYNAFPPQQNNQKKGETYTKDEFQAAVTKAATEAVDKKQADDRISSLEGNITKIVDAIQDMRTNPPGVSAPTAEDTAMTIIGDIAKGVVSGDNKGDSETVKVLKEQVAKAERDKAINESELRIKAHLDQLNASNVDLKNQLGSLQTHGSGMSENAAIAVEQIKAQTQIVKGGIDTLNNTLQSGFKFAGDLVKTDRPEGVDKVKQWTENEEDEINNYLDG